IALRRMAQSFIAGRKWSTASICYGDQPEPQFSEDSAKPMWSMCFNLGLDHVRHTESDWFADVAAIADFLQPIAREIGCEFIMEIRLKSRLWYSETLMFISKESDVELDLPGARSMLEHFIKPNREDKFLAKWGGRRVLGRNRFLLANVFWVGFTA